MSSSRETGGQEKRERIGDYILSNEIGRGSFATVYKGYRSTTRTPIAIKAVARQKLTPKLLENLEGEINILKTISHPHVVELIDCIKNDHHIYLIMAFCSGGDLSVYIKKRGKLPTLDYRPFPGAEPIFWPHPKEGGLDDRVARCFLGQLAEALKFLRERNLIHRDIKPQNLLLQPPTEAQYAAGHPLGIPILKVADFGFARFLPSTDLASTLCGSPLYMAPEILRYEKYDAKADLWSVGAVLYEMMVGRPPFRAQNHVELLRKIEKGEDRIKFPDESSSRSRTDGDRDKPEETAGPPVAADVKNLIRRLLKRVPVQRMSFEDFFACKVWDGYMKTVGYQDQTAGPEPSGAGVIGSVMTRNSPGPTEKRSTPPHRAQREQTTPRRPSEPKYFVSNIPSRSVLEDSEDGSQNKASFTQDTDRRDASRATPVRAGPSRQNSGSDDVTVGRPSRGATPLQPTSSEHDQQSSASATDTNEYVVVEKRTVEVNALADELEAAVRRPTGLVRRSSRTSALGRPMSALTIGSGGVAPSSPSSYSPPFSLSTTPPFGMGQQNGLRPTSLQAMTPSPSSNARSRPILVPQPNQRSGTPGLSYQHAIQDGRPSGSPGSLQSHSLARAISSASLRWFGSSPVNVLSRFSGRPWARARTLTQGTEDAAAEDELLDYLGDIARKATVLFEFADSKLALCVTALRTSPALGGLPAAIATDHSPANIPTDQPRARRRSSSGSTSSGDLTAARLEVLCAEALVLYLKALAFLQHGVERARKFWENSAAPNSGLGSSPDFNETVQWFRSHFNDCFEKAEWAKSKCSEDMPESASYVEKLIYDKAIELSRAAAINELVGEDLSVSETGYETALWLLYAVLDSILHDGQLVGDADRAMIEKVVVSIRIRLSALYEKTSAFSRKESTSQPLSPIT